MFSCFRVFKSAADCGGHVCCCSLWWPQVARYFGFAQQVAVELGPLLPQEVRHSMAFVSVLVSMAIDKNEVCGCVPLLFLLYQHRVLWPRADTTVVSRVHTIWANLQTPPFYCLYRRIYIPSTLMNWALMRTLSVR